MIGFGGTVTETVGAVASGQSGKTSGSQTIQLGRVIHQVHFHLYDKRHKGSIYEFIGSATGGKVQVDDSLDDTGTDEHGELKYDHPADGHSEAGDSIIDFRACAYNFAALANVSGTYEGDQSVEPSDFGQLRRSERKLGGATQPDPARRRFGHRYVRGYLRLQQLLHHQPTGLPPLEAAGPPN